MIKIKYLSDIVKVLQELDATAKSYPVNIN